VFGLSGSTELFLRGEKQSICPRVIRNGSLSQFGSPANPKPSAINLRQPLMSFAIPNINQESQHESPHREELSSRRFSRHVPALDGIRGLAILMVTLYRFNIGPAYDRFPGNLLFAVLQRGDLGVDLFFVLSGFLITGILFDAKGQDHYFRNFYARRALRIFPLYYGFLLITLVVLPRLLGPGWVLFPEAEANQAWLWLYGANFLMGIRDEWCLGSFQHFWSLSVEEHFYLLWPLVIFLCSRRRAMQVALGVVVFSVLGRIVWIRMGGNQVAVDTFTFFRMDGLGIGAFLALWARGTEGLKPWKSWASVVLGLCGGVLLVVGILGNRRLLGIPWAITVVFFGALLVLAVLAGPGTFWGRLWRSRILAFFGKYSYAMYVFQLPLIAVLAPVVTAEALCSLLGSNFFGRLAYIAIMTAITTLAAVLSWYGYEKHFLRLKAFFPTSRNRPTTVPVAPSPPPAWKP
jgi:peptidoglycan/LPS O-acetylase OafA/YrhL